MLHDSPLVVKRVIRFLPSESPDVVGYVLYWGPEGSTLAHKDQAGNPSPQFPLGIPSVDANGKFVVALDEIPPIASLPEGNYVLGVASEDDVGNRSAIKAVTTPLDLEPPASVDGVEVTEA
jgi:hypothetical protein